MKGFGLRWMCTDCGRVMDKPPIVINSEESLVMSLPGRYHSYKCNNPMVQVAVTEADINTKVGDLAVAVINAHTTLKAQCFCDFDFVDPRCAAAFAWIKALAKDES